MVGTKVSTIIFMCIIRIKPPLEMPVIESVHVR